MSLKPLFPLTTQFQGMDGENLVAGLLKVYLSDTDDTAETFSDSTGETLNPSPIVLDNLGMAPVWVEPGKVYRLEVYHRSGALLYTRYPMYPSDGEGSGESTEIISTDGSVAVDKTHVGTLTQFDLSVAKDSSEYLEYAHCTEARVPTSNVFYPIGDEGSTLFSDNTGIVLTANGLFHITLKMRATKSVAVPFYDKVNIFVKTDDGTVSEQIEFSALIDGSLGLSQEFEISGDVRTGSANTTRLFVTVEDTSVAGVSYEFVGMDIHRIFSGVPHIPGINLVAGSNITLTKNNGNLTISSSGGGGGGGETYEAGEGIAISNGKVSVILSETEDGEGSGLRFLVHGEHYPEPYLSPVAFKFHVGAAQDQNMNAGGDFVLCGLNYLGNYAYFPGVMDDGAVAVPVLVDINDMTRYIVGQPLTGELPYTAMGGSYARYIPVGKYSSDYNHSSMVTQFGYSWRNYIDSNGDIYISICAYKSGVGLLGTGDGPDGHAVLYCSPRTAFFSISSDRHGWNTVPFTELSGGKLDLISEQLQRKVVAGNGITIDNSNVISTTGASVPTPSQGGGRRFLRCDNDGTMSWTEGATVYKVLTASPDVSEIAQIVSDAAQLTEKGSALVIGIYNSYDGSLMWYRQSIFKLTSASTGTVGFTCCTPDYVGGGWVNGFYTAVFYADADPTQNYSRFMAGFGNNIHVWDPWMNFGG